MSPRPTPSASRTYHHGDLHRALVEAAFTLVTEEQSWTFSLREVARRAGVSHNAPYNHFADKRELLGAVAVRGFELLRDSLTAAAESAASGDQVIHAIARAYAGQALANPALYRLMFGPEFGFEPPRPVHEASEATRGCVLTVVTRAIASGQFAIDPSDDSAMDFFTLSCWSMLHGIVMMLIDGKSRDPNQPPMRLVDALMGNLLVGLLAR